MNSLRLTRLVLACSVPTLIVCTVILHYSYGLVRVPAGMDTMVETHPPGTLCVIEKSPGSLPANSVVFVDLPDGSTVLTRAVAVNADGGIDIRHDNRASRFQYLESAGPYPLQAVRGHVLSFFLPDPKGAPDLGQ